MEKNKIYFLPWYEKIVPIIFGLLSIFGIIYSTTLIDNEDKYIVITGSIILFLVVLCSIEVFSVKYIFKDDRIIVKFPFFKEKTCYLKNVIGFAVRTIKQSSSIIIYSENSEIIIARNGKKLKQEIKEFENNNYMKVKNRNLKELEENGIKYAEKKNKIIMFYKDKIEIYKNDTKIKCYDYSKDIINISFDSEILALYTSDNQKIGINIYKCKGRIGLFDYILYNKRMQ
ncbi:hypothetical protein FACS189476_00730 [Spirochaetia bacterium]|nr:hypothetical protein FACS189476_00730 [Spirochaetia bacterium]